MIISTKKCTSFESVRSGWAEAIICTVMLTPNAFFRSWSFKDIREAPISNEQREEDRSKQWTGKAGIEVKDILIQKEGNLRASLQVWLQKPRSFSFSHVFCMFWTSLFVQKFSVPNCLLTCCPCCLVKQVNSTVCARLSVLFLCL